MFFAGAAAVPGAFGRGWVPVVLAGGRMLIGGGSAGAAAGLGAAAALGAAEASGRFGVRAGAGAFGRGLAGTAGGGSTVPVCAGAA